MIHGVHPLIRNGKSTCTTHYAVFNRFLGLFYCLPWLLKKFTPLLAIKMTPKPENPKTHAKKHVECNSLCDIFQEEK